VRTLASEERSPQDGFGLLELSTRLQHRTEAVEDHKDVGVRRSARALEDPERAPVILRGVREATRGGKGVTERRREIRGT
jgi:hypothetical protein